MANKKRKWLECTTIDCINTDVFYKRVITDTHMLSNMSTFRGTMIKSKAYFCNSCDKKAIVKEEE
jgi:hypothetical protein